MIEKESTEESSSFKLSEEKEVSVEEKTFLQYYWPYIVLGIAVVIFIVLQLT